MGDENQNLQITKPRGWTRIHQYFHDHHAARYVLMAITLVIASAIGVVFWLWQQPEQKVATKPAAVIKKKEEPKIYAPLTGAQVADPAIAKRPVTAVMIENSPDSRPQSGLKQAGIVYETIAEGGITRFIALYQENRPGLIGPVRSVRPYYVEWASAYDPSVAHVGGSARALTMIRSGNYGTDLDQFFNAPSYWRAKDRYAPHNVYTNSDQLDALITSKGRSTSNFTPQPRKDDTKAKQPNAQRINIPVSSASYNIDYIYDPASNSYARHMGGGPHADREEGQIQPKVAIVLNVPISRAFEDGYREQIATTGQGRAFLFQDGTVRELTWSRPEPKSHLQLLDAEGKDVPLNRGQTWITAIADGKTPTWQ